MPARRGGRGDKGAAFVGGGGFDVAWLLLLVLSEQGGGGTGGALFRASLCAKGRFKEWAEEGRGNRVAFRGA